MLAPAAAQTPGPARTIHIGVPRSYLVAGTQMQLTAVARDQNGVARTGDTFSWSVGTPSAPAVEVDANGMVTGTGIGTPVISATLGALRAQVQIQVLPARIEVTPRKTRVAVGGRQEFSAAVFDSRGAPIQFNPFGLSWNVTSANGGGTQMARIDGSGALTAVSTGRVTVRAQINYGFPPIQLVPNVIGAAVIDIVSPSAFRMRRLLSSADTLPGFTIRPMSSNTPISVNDSGQVVAQVSLDGLSNGVALYGNGRLDLIARAGVPGFLPGTVYGGFGTPILNNRGRAVFNFGLNFGPGGIATGARGEDPEVIAYDGLYVGGSVRLRDRFNPYAINDEGDVAFIAGYNTEDNRRYEGIFKYSRGLIELVWSSELALPGLSLGANVNFGGVVIDPAGNVYFSANGQTGSAVYSRIGFGRVTRVIGTGDALNGIAVGGVGPLSASPDGSLAFFVDGNAVRLANGRITTGPAAGCCGASLVNTRAGVLLLGNFGRGQGAYLWQGDTTTPLYLTGRLAPNGEPVLNLSSAGLTSTGQLIAAARTPNNPMLVFAPGLANPVLFQTGDRVDVAGGVFVRSLIRGARTGPLRLYTGGFGGGSIFEVGDLGLTGVVVTGDRLPSREFFIGSSDPVETPGGDLYFSSLSDGTAVRLRGGRLEALPRDVGDGRGVYVNYAASANDRGQGLYTAGTCCPGGGQRLFLTDGNRVTLVFDPSSPPRTPEGTVSFFANAALDEDGRIMLDVNLQGEGPVNRLYLWEAGQWRVTATRDVTEVGGATIVNIGPAVSAGRRFYTTFGLRGGGNVLAEFNGDSWTPLTAREQMTPMGLLMNGVGPFDVNRNGEVAFQATFNGGGGAVLFRDAQGELRNVHFGFEPTEQGDYLLNIQRILLRDDRRIYILAADVNENLVVYEATPLF